MQATNQKNWLITSRFHGVMKYHANQLGKTVLYVLLVLLASEVFSILISIFTNTTTYVVGSTANFGVAMVFVLVCACSVAGKSTRFVLRFGTSRFSTWLANILSLILWMIVLLVGTMILSLVMTIVEVVLAGSMPEKFVTMWAFSEGATVQNVFADLWAFIVEWFPRQCLWIAEWSCIFYLFGCCLRRNKKLTLAILVGIPVLAMMSMFIPTIRETLKAIGNMNEGEIMKQGLLIYRWISDAMIWIGKHWKWVQLSAAGVSLPLSYLCMRNTPQP